MLQAIGDSSTRTSRATRQHTVAGPVHIEGKGLLLGEDARMTMMPAPANHGIVFERVDLDPPVQIPAVVTNVARRHQLLDVRGASEKGETLAGVFFSGPAHSTLIVFVLCCATR